MFSLFYGLWKYLFTKTEFHVLFLGIDKAGKTTLLEKLKSVYLNMESLPLDRIVPTVGLNIGRIEVTNSKLVFWDLGGQPGLRSIWEKYYEEAHAVVYVIDAACPSRFEDAKSALEKVLRHEDLRGAPLLILANKQDLSEAMSAEELAQYLDLKNLDERAYMFEAVSAYDGLGIKESVEWLVEVMERSKRTETLSARAGVSDRYEYLSGKSYQDVSVSGFRLPRCGRSPPLNGHLAASSWDDFVKGTSEMVVSTARKA